ncbi:Rad4 family protein [Aspergillus clavatus NRRL 1]|uniref:Rad4 family protein n=1 Tax=Aspergillus clavatus (strain ATCC 1007 / CBS 513.65 / DSM 816 / NCTC 3887 / NRRL 1 / QM 1276 / 107) TaxID=344612 RepID=A1C6K8_ASPCL|nr:Rad4 family protein [Aspergillus clavatus NRRL 1]EAW14029.1 Rad4 family protein [Aspergillus clavatus NRRL 1]
MPPFVPRKRVSSEDPPTAKRPNVTPVVEIADFDEDSDSDSDSSLSDAPSSDDEPKAGQAVQKQKKAPEDSESEDDDEVDWEDAFDSKSVPAPTPLSLAVPVQDLELTLDKNDLHVPETFDSKKGPTKIERQIRIATHCLHVQFLLYHNAVRNAWASDAKLHETLRRKLPAGIHKEVKKWRVASGLELPEKKPEEKKSKRKKGKQARKPDRDWGDESSRLEPGRPDMSRGDPIISLLKILTAYWRKQFKITAPGLRKGGYRPMAHLEMEISSFQKDEHDPEIHGERIRNVEEFRSAAERMEGSRDVGAQLFTALLRALAIEARLVANLQPLGFGWTKAEIYTVKPKVEEGAVSDKTEPEAIVGLESDSSDSDIAPSGRSNSVKKYDKDLPFPIYWTEVASPVTHEIIPVDPLILSNPVATTPELQAAFEPRGSKAEKAKQVICYVVAYSSDKTAKDVTTRYLRRRTWPGKTKGYRIPVEKIPVPGRKGKSYEYDWFRTIMRVYERAHKDRTAVDDIEDAKDLLPNQPEKKQVKEGDTLQSLRSSTEFVLERFLRREEALRPGAQHARTFTTGKGDKAKEEKVYRRADVLKCLSAESWHKEGRQIKVGEAPLKRVPIRAVTLLRKREVDELERETGEKPKQGLYAKYQTEYIIPPPIRDGIIPKNDYGNIDCFVPSMVPRGAVHIPWPGTVRICKKLGIDFAEAVTGFEFGSKMAVPVIQGVVVAAENEDLVKDAWRVDDAEKRKREQLKAEKRILQTWRKFLFGLRIAERVREEYGPGGGDDDADLDMERDSHNPFASRQSRSQPQGPLPAQEALRESSEEPADRGGGFLLPGENDGDDGDLVVESHPPRRTRLSLHEGEERDKEEEEEEEEEEEDEDEDEEMRDNEAISISSDEDEDLSSPPQIPDSEDDEPLSSEYEAPPTRRRTRNAGKGAR